jgi:hypothetical protein
MDFRPRLGSKRELRRNARLSFENPAIRLNHGDVIRRHPEGGEAAHQFRCREHLVAQTVDLGAGQRSLDQGAVRRPDLHDTGDVEECSRGGCFKLTPQFISVPQQRDVGRMLEISKSNDACRAMG